MVAVEVEGVGPTSLDMVYGGANLGGGRRVGVVCVIKWWE